MGDRFPWSVAHLADRDEGGLSAALDLGGALANARAAFRVIRIQLQDFSAGNHVTARACRTTSE
jgi:hypothetical protein